MDGLRITHIGGPTVLLEVAGWRILTDPTFDPPGRTYHFGWGSSSRKVRGPAMAVAELGTIDAVLLTHDHHADNLDDAGRTLLADVPRIVTTASGSRRLGSGAVGVEPWATTVLEAPGRPAITLTATPCRHGPPFSHAIVGDVVGFAIQWEGQEHGVVWVSGDTVLYDGVRSVADRLDIDVAILHVGGARFTVTGPLRYTMTARDAVELCRTLRPRTVIPVHYEGWSHFRDGPDAIEAALAQAPSEIRDTFRLLPLGTATAIAR